VKALVIVAAAMMLAGCGGGSATVDRTVAVDMVDIAYQPAALAVRKGETIRFEFANTGKLTHEAVLGDAKAQDEHEKMGSDMHHGHGSSVVEVKPDKSGSLKSTFDKAGTTYIGCHIPGHYKAGMRITITVS
jgi:uncharacterized cupredoxin-like copper-binding protein